MYPKVTDSSHQEGWPLGPAWSDPKYTVGYGLWQAVYVLVLGYFTWGSCLMLDRSTFEQFCLLESNLYLIIYIYIAGA